MKKYIIIFACICVFVLGIGVYFIYEDLNKLEVQERNQWIDKNLDTHFTKALADFSEGYTAIISGDVSGYDKITNSVNTINSDVNRLESVIPPNDPQIIAIREKLIETLKGCADEIQTWSTEYPTNPESANNSFDKIMNYSDKMTSLIKKINDLKKQ